MRPGCGCTTAGEWTKTVEPGKTGNIPIQVNTANFNGPVAKVVNVDTSDPTQQTVVLQVKGTLWKPVDVQPSLAYFTASADSPTVASSVVHIKSNLEKPLSLAVPEISNKAFNVEVKPVEAGKDYQVVVGLTKDATNVGPSRRHYFQDDFRRSAHRFIHCLCECAGGSFGFAPRHCAPDGTACEQSYPGVYDSKQWDKQFEAFRGSGFTYQCLGAGF